MRRTDDLLSQRSPTQNISICKRSEWRKAFPSYVDHAPFEVLSMQAVDRAKDSASLLSRVPVRLGETIAKARPCRPEKATDLSRSVSPLSIGSGLGCRGRNTSS